MDLTNKVVSIKDIAAISGVSVATVSRVLNNKGKYSEETKNRVLAIANQYGYVSNMAAKSLRESKSHTIGLIIPNITNTFFSNIAYSIETYLFKNNYSLLICNSSNNADKERTYFKTLASKNVDGILCISELNEMPKEILSRDIPIISVDRHPLSSTEIPWVGNDDVIMSQNATEHLISHGCKHILFISSYHSEYNHKLRLHGYENALNAHQFSINKNLILERIGKQSTLEEVQSLVENVINQNLFFDGILASSEMAGIGALTALKNKGMRVPEDVKILCFDNSYLSTIATPSLTSIERNPKHIAQKSCELLLSIINGDIPPETEICIPTSLIERESTI